MTWLSPSIYLTIMMIIVIDIDLIIVLQNIRYSTSTYVYVYAVHKIKKIKKFVIAKILFTGLIFFFFKLTSYCIVFSLSYYLPQYVRNILWECTMEIIFQLPSSVHSPYLALIFIFDFRFFSDVSIDFKFSTIIWPNFFKIFVDVFADSLSSWVMKAMEVGSLWMQWQSTLSAHPHITMILITNTL